MKTLNIFQNVPQDQTSEVIEKLAESAGARVERIVSFGQSTPDGEWYDQPQEEWVLLLKGKAGLVFGESEGKPEERVELGPGDYLTIPAHRRHRVEWTAKGEETVWVAVHF